MEIYTIRLTYLLGWSKGRTGYHSVWKDKDAAQRVADRLNDKYGREISYSVEGKSEFQIKKSMCGVNFANATSVKFDDSVGWLIFADGDSEQIRKLMEERDVCYGELINGKLITGR
jgi:hypothetical protein